MFKLNKKIVRLFTLAALVLGVISLFWLVYDYFLYNQLKPVILSSGELGRLEQLAEFVWLSYLFMFMVHIIAGVTLLLHLRYFRVIHNEKILVRGEYFWFPFLIFTSQTLFSVLTLVHYKEN